MGKHLLHSIQEKTNQAFYDSNRIIKLHQVLQATLFLFAGFTLYLFLESAFYLSVWLKTGFVFASILGAVYVFISRKKETHVDYKAFYRNLAKEAELPELPYALDLIEHHGKDSPEFESIALVQLDQTLQQKNWHARITALLETHPLRKRNRNLSFLIAVLGLFWMIPAFYGDSSFQRSLEFWTSFEKPNPFNFAVLPGDTLLEQGQFLRFDITFKGKEPQKIHLEYKTEIESNFRSFPLKKVDSAYVSELLQISESSTYRFVMDEYNSKSYLVEVQSLPRFDSLLVEVIPPTYTKAEKLHLRYPTSDIEFPEGSTVQLSGFPNKRLQLAQIQFLVANNSVWFPFDSSFYSYSFQSQKNDTLHFYLKDEFGLKNQNPYPLILSAIKDKNPSVTLLKPNPVTTLSTETEIELLFESSDDYGLQRTDLVFEVKRLFKATPEKAKITLPNGRKMGLQTYIWDFSSLNIQPQDEVSYWIQVWDNDAINGSKAGRSATFVLRIPSLTEQFLGEQELEAEVENNFSEIDQRFEQMKAEYKEFLEQLTEKPTEITENQRKLDAVQERQEQIDEKVKEINKKFDELQKELDQNNQLSDETKKAYDDLQKLVQEIQNDEFKKAMEELEKALNNFDQRSIQQALQDVKFNEEKYRERLTRTMELFKQVKLNADLDRIKKSIDDLAAKQEDLENNTESSTEKQIEQQNQLKKEVDKLKELTEKLDSNPPEKLKDSVSELQKQLEQEMDEAQEEMNDASQQMQQENKDGAKKKQKSAKSKLKKASEMASAFQQKMGKEQEMLDKAALESILTQIMLLSETEELIAFKTDELDFKSNGFVIQARGQQIINQVFGQVGDSLYALSTVNAALSNRILEKKAEVQRNLDRSLTFLSERDRPSSLAQIRLALGGVNELATLLVDILEQADNQSGGGGGGGSMSPEQMMQQMKKMSGEQQQLNQQLQNMINDMQGNRLNQNSMERLEQLSKMQQSIRKQLEELKKNGGLQQGDRMMSELQRLTEEMEDAINDMRGGQADRIMVKRQQNILTRMLQAEKAFDERDEDEKRKADQVKEELYSIPPPVTLEELKKRLLLQLQNGELTPFTKDYQKLIDLYFQELEKRVN